VFCQPQECIVPSASNGRPHKDDNDWRTGETGMVELESMAVEMPKVEGHPNRVGFCGVLTVVDVASERAPSGSKGHRVVLTKLAAEAALPSLLGMALDYAPSFDRHDQRRKVGVITSAEIIGRNLEVGGYLYAKDFPEIVDQIAMSGRRPQAKCNSKEGDRKADEAVNSPKGCLEGLGLRASLSSSVRKIRELKALARAAGVPSGRHEARREPGLPPAPLGMSYEVTEVVLADTRASVWTLTRVTFTGAAVLRRDKAAYEHTWIELID
jgi:hypothetical protein